MTMNQSNRITPEEAQAQLNDALQKHIAGDLDYALPIYEKLYEQGVGDVTNDAAHLLANVYKTRGQLVHALMWVNKAILKNPHAIYLNTRGSIFLDMNRPADALNDLSRSLKAQPQNYELMVNLCAAHRTLKNHKKALDFGQQATSARPDGDLAWINLAGISIDQGKTQQALDYYKKAIEINPNQPMGNLNLAKVVKQYGKPEEAFEYWERAAQLSPNNFDAQVGYAGALIKADRKVEAVEPLIRALEAGKKVDIKNLTEDTEMFTTMLEVANMVRMLSQHDKTEYVFKRLLEVAPQVEMFWVNLASAHVERGRYQEAHDCLAKVLDVNPDSYVALQGRANLYMLQTYIEGSLKDLQRIRHYQPRNISNLSWVFAESLHGAYWDEVEDVRQQLIQLFKENPKDNAINTFIMLSVTDSGALQLENAIAACNQLEAPYLALKCQNSIKKSKKNDRIKVGYISHDFRQHPLGILAAEMFALHDRKHFEVTAYNYSADDGSEIRKRIKGTAERFVDMTTQSILEMAENIRADGCEILIDLTCSTRGGRPQVMCLRPAPVQAAWLGFIGTTGSKYYDYVIADTTIIPEEHFSYYSEKTLRLPQTMQINDPNRSTPRADVKKSDFGIDEDTYLLCSFNQAYKTQPKMYAHWMKILKAVPNAKLWLLQDNQWATEHWKEEMRKTELDPDQRLIIAPKMPLAQHLERYAVADLALDTYSVNSGATASDALWGGAPMLSVLGDSMVSRMGSSLVRAAELGDQMVTNSFDEYVERAIYYGNHRDELAALKRHLQENRKTLPLFDAPRLIKDLETGFAEVAQMIRSGKPYEHVTVK
jgi:protein O-GlcNAc transferase